MDSKVNNNKAVLMSERLLHLEENMRREFIGEISPENISKLTAQAGQEMERILQEEERVIEMTCRIKILPQEPMQYEIDFSTFHDIRTIN